MSQKQDSLGCSQMSFEFTNAHAVTDQACVLPSQCEDQMATAKVYFLPTSVARLSTENVTEAHAIQRLIARAKALPW